jgi:uncharacterized protein YjbI with pentapeptide repeats/AAA+ superfamily predicted ATPase
MLMAGDVSGFNQARPEGAFDLTGVTLADVVLDGARLDDLILRRADLSGASLIGSSLNRAVLDHATLEHAVIDRARFRRATLRNADLRSVSAREADFQLADLVRADLSDGVFRGALFNHAVLYDATLAAATFEGADLDHANLASSLLDRTCLARANLPGARLFGTLGEDVDFHEANLTGAEALCARYSGEHVRFDGAYVRGFVHDGLGREGDPFVKAIKDREPAPGTFPARDLPPEEAILIRGIPGTSQILWDAAMRDLDELVGLGQVKDQVRRIFDRMLYRHDRLQFGLPVTEISYHMVFKGPPGTGKTTIAEIVNRLLTAIGHHKKGQFISTDPDGLIAQYVGQTGPQTHEKVKEALDGMLFVDEAYGLAEGGEQGYGPQAVRALLLDAENFRDRFTCIIAGYDEDIDRLLRFNRGFRSRFRIVIPFENYSIPELVEIMTARLRKYRFEYDHRFVALASVLYALRKERMDREERVGSGIKFANAREVRQSIESMEEQISSRIALQPKSRKTLVALAHEDLPFESLTGVPATAVPLAALRWCPAEGTGAEVNYDALPLSGRFPELAEASLARIFSLLPPAS